MINHLFWSEYDFGGWKTASLRLSVLLQGINQQQSELVHLDHRSCSHSSTSELVTWTLLSPWGNFSFFRSTVQQLTQRSVDRAEIQWIQNGTNQQQVKQHENRKHRDAEDLTWLKVQVSMMFVLHCPNTVYTVCFNFLQGNDKDCCIVYWPRYMRALVSVSQCRA